MTDTEFLQAFRNGTLSAECFRHGDHVKAAWLYLQNQPILSALTSFSADLRKFACAKGAPGKYHETITWACLFLIHERMERMGTGQSWEDFLIANPDLMDWDPPILTRYYTRTTLNSDVARKVFILPDKAVSTDENPFA